MPRKNKINKVKLSTVNPEFLARNGDVGIYQDRTVLNYRHLRRDPTPVPVAGYALVPRRGVLRLPTSTTGASSINLTSGDVASMCNIGATPGTGFYIEAIRAWAYGTQNTVRTAIFDLKAINNGDQNFELQVQDIAPPDSMPGVEFIFPRGQRPSFTQGSSSTFVLMTVTPEQVGYAYFEVDVVCFF